MELSSATQRCTPPRIVGIGAITALGADVETTWRRCLDGDTGIGAPTTLDLPDLPVVRVAEAIEAGPYRALRLARIAATAALEDAGWDRPDALVVATTKGGIGLAQRVLEGSASADLLPSFPLFALAGRLAGELGVTGPVQTLSLACASGTAALGHAGRLIAAGRARRVLVVGADALSEFVVRGFACLRALGRGAARPFDVERTGLSVGEGAAALALEGGDGDARARLLGYCGTNDAHHITGPDREGRGLARAILGVLAQSGVQASEIAAVSAHGTGTVYNDAMEGYANRTALIGARPPVNSIKGALGHTLGAAGAIEAVLAVRAIQTRMWPPTAGLITRDPDIDLDVVAGVARRIDAGPILSTSSGFSGVNAAVLIG